MKKELIYDLFNIALGLGIAAVGIFGLTKQKKKSATNTQEQPAAAPAQETEIPSFAPETPPPAI